VDDEELACGYLRELLASHPEIVVAAAWGRTIEESKTVGTGYVFMGQRKYPPLTHAEVIAILSNLGFTKAREEGSHAHFEALASGHYPRSLVTVDTGYREFDESRIKTMIRQSNRTRELFYGATKGTARKASVQFAKPAPSTELD
jgi:predicted RNA binding protein YcfA (HicA-like mRNA interferase family)